MGLEVFWTDNAKNQLEDIYDFYKLEASTNTARNLVRKIINRTISLETNPKIDPQEPLLSDREFDYRYLVEGNYKIIYWISDNFVKIAAVFDCRRNPGKNLQDLIYLHFKPRNSSVL